MKNATLKLTTILSMLFICSSVFAYTNCICTNTQIYTQGQQCTTSGGAVIHTCLTQTCQGSAMCGRTTPTKKANFINSLAPEFNLSSEQNN